VTWLEAGGVPLAVAALAFARGRLDPPASFCVVYAAIAIVIGVLLGGGADVDANVLFDADIALALAAAVALTRRPAIPRTVLAVPAAFWIALNFDSSWFAVRPYAAADGDSAAAIAAIRAQPAPAWCQAMALCFWAGQPQGPDTFALAQRYQRGR